MEKEKQLLILKQGVDVWNEWREENHYMPIDLSKADLRATDLSKINFTGVTLNGAILSESNLMDANMRGASLYEANLNGAKLIGANLYIAHLNRATLTESDLSSASLISANFSGVNLRDARLIGTDLRGAILGGANLAGADLRRANFTGAVMGGTIFAGSDLTETLGLEYISHIAPSSISLDLLALARGRLPEIFLKNCGVSDADIEYSKLYNPELSNDQINKILYRVYDLRAAQAIQVSPLFISYSHMDSEFVQKISDCLSDKGIRYWRDIHEMKAGRMEEQIDRAISQNPTVLLVLSQHSLSSDWVEHEVRTARRLEKEMQRDILCPITLDDSWKSSRWPKRLMEQIMEYNILDFSEWKDDSSFGIIFNKLIGGLELFYKA